MGELLHIAIAWPTVAYTLLSGLALLYWLFVILGALDIDFLEFDVDVDLELDGAGDGAAEGGLSGALGLLTALRLRNAPLTVTFSFLFLFSWAFCVLGVHYLGATGFGMGAAVFAGAFAASIPITGVITRPMRPLFAARSGTTRAQLVGKTCVVTTGRVDVGFGQAEVSAGGDHLLLQVRCREGNELERGREALIIDYDEEREAYTVEPLGGSS
jgi:hypothetical protein